MKQENEEAILVSNYSLKRSFQTETDYSVVINKRTKIDTVAKCPFKFERIPEIPVTKIKEVQKLPDYTVVSLYGKIDCSAAPEEVKLTGRSLTKQDCFIADDSDVIKLTLWEKQISAVENGKTYRIDNGRVRTYQGEKYVTLNTDSTVTITKDENFGSIFVSGQPSSIKRNRTRNPNRARLRIRARNTERGHLLPRSDLNELDWRFSSYRARYISHSIARSDRINFCFWATEPD